MRTLVTIVFLVVLGLAAAAGPAHAGPDDDRKAAQKLIDEGLALARAKKFRDAIPKFEDALKLYPHPEIQHNLARAHEELGELREAYDLFAQALKQDYTYAADARARLPRIEAELRKSYARLTVRTTPSQVSVVLTFPDGAEEAHLQAPFATWAPAGRTKVVGTNPNFKTKEENLDLAAGEDRELQLVLVPLPRQGFLAVRVNIAGATVSLAGQPIGKSPLESIPYEAGPYRLDVTAKGYKPVTQEVVIVQDEVTTVNVALEADVTQPPDEPSAGVAPWVGWTLVGTGVAAGAVAAYLQFGIARPAQDDANTKGATDDAIYAKYHAKAVKYETAAQLTTVGAVLLAGTGAFLLLFEAPAASDDSVGVVPLLTPLPGGGAVGAMVAF